MARGYAFGQLLFPVERALFKRVNVTDLEIVFMYPWAVVYREMIVESKLVLWSMLSFISILMVGYVYALKKGALDWKK